MYHLSAPDGVSLNDFIHAELQTYEDLELYLARLKKDIIV